MAEITIDPVTRVEGHLRIKLDVDDAGFVTSAQVAGNLYRDFENILRWRHPWDAVQLTQRICGVCPVSHALVSTKAMENAQGFTPSAQARLMRALILGANYLQDHVLHFYHLSLMDYIAGPAMSPWQADTPDLRFTQSQTELLIEHYVKALEARRQAQEMGALLAGRLPHVASIHPGGVTKAPSYADINLFRSYLAKIRTFVETVYRPDAELLAAVYPDYFEVGAGPDSYLSVGSFDLPGGAVLFPPGLVVDGIKVGNPDPGKIREYVGSSYYSSSSGLAPLAGQTVPDIDKAGAYSWLKAPRYDGRVMEVGPLARMRLAGKYQGGSSVMDRIQARALETSLIATAMGSWLSQLIAGRSAFTVLEPRITSSGLGYAEAPRGTLAHWVQYTNRQTTRYQIVTPTCWNGSPRDDSGLPGAIESALVGLTIADPARPIEAVRVVHSFDPCIGCAVHVTRSRSPLSTEFIVR